MAKGKKYFLSVVIGGKDALSAVLGKAGRSVKAFGAGLATAGKRLWTGAKETAKFVAGLGFIVYGAQRAGGFLYGLAKSAADVGGALADLRTRTGLGTAMLQELHFVAEQGGMTMEEFAGSMQVATKNIGDLAAGRGKLKGFLSAVAGPDFARALKKASPETRLELVIGGLLQIKDEAKRAAYAQAFFGESGGKMAALADLGADKIAELRKEARDLGVVMSEDDVDALDEVGDELGKLERGVDAVKRKFGVELARAALPVLKEAVTWIKANREEIGKFAKAFGAGVVDAAKGLKDAFVWLYEHREDILAWAKLLGVALMASLGPVAAAVAALVGLFAELKRWSNQTPGERKEEFGGAIEIGEGHAALIDAMAGKGTSKWWNRNAREIQAEGAAEVATEKVAGTGIVLGARASLEKSQQIAANQALGAMRKLAQPWASPSAPQRSEVKITIDDQRGVVRDAKVVDAPKGSQPVVVLDKGRRRIDPLR
ncbi:MAG: hypothetical protein IT385_08185 [Deltaproteobacteria bacterium]|nr:hypothetical protein [Deltaproteobacteria bacterium]